MGRKEVDELQHSKNKVIYSGKNKVNDNLQKIMGCGLSATEKSSEHHQPRVHHNKRGWGTDSILLSLLTGLCNFSTPG